MKSRRQLIEDLEGLPIDTRQICICLKPSTWANLLATADEGFKKSVGNVWAGIQHIEAQLDQQIDMIAEERHP